MASYQLSSIRPTLPPLSSLDLPTPSLREQMELLKFNDTDDSYDYPTSAPPRFNQRNRQTSISSSITSRSSSTSPPPSDFSIATGLSASGHHNSSSSSHADTPRYRLVRSSFENADAVLIVPPPMTPYVPPLSSLATSANISKKGQGLLLVGPAMHQHLRHPQRNIARGARIHPYRIMRVDTSKKSSPPSSLLSRP